ncbi:MAG: outer membrane beta-barrel protein [Candidatus Sulfotelmatobacter sp.]
MIGKFATASVLLLLILTTMLGGRGFAQATPSGESPSSPAPAPQQPPAQQPATQPPAGQQPATQQPAAPPTAGEQEATEEETSSSRRKKPHDYKNWSYNVGAGANIDGGTTHTFVRGGGVVGNAGVARNGNKYLGLRADFIFANLPLRDSSLQLAQAGSASSYLFALTLDPIINVPVTKTFGGYVLFGPGYYHRFGTLNSDTAIPGSSCNAFFDWWGACPNVSLPLSGSFVNSSQNQFGYNVGAGITRKMPSGVEIYAEYRLAHGTGNGTTTDVRPITVGVRW